MQLKSLEFHILDNDGCGSPTLEEFAFLDISGDHLNPRKLDDELGAHLLSLRFPLIMSFCLVPSLLQSLNSSG